MMKRMMTWLFRYQAFGLSSLHLFVSILMYSAVSVNGVPTALIVDSPVRPHIRINPYWDLSLMKKIKVRYQRRVGNIMEEHVSDLADLNAQEAQIFSNDPNADELKLNHGTQMASLICSGLRCSRIINYPYIVADPNYTAEMVEKDLNASDGELRKELAAWFSPIQEILNQTDIPVVNLSIGLSAEEIEPAYESLVLHLLRKPGRRSEVPSLARRIATIHQSEFLKLILNNPNVVFVLAAGSEGIDLRKNYTTSLPAVNAPNLLVVAKGSGDQAYGNYSPEHVHLAAPYHMLVGFPGTLDSHYISGSSVSTAITTQQIMTFLEDGNIQNLRGPALVHEFLKKYSKSVEALKPYIKGGRSLVIQARGWTDEILPDLKLIKKDPARLPLERIFRVSRPFGSERFVDARCGHSIARLVGDSEKLQAVYLLTDSQLNKASKISSRSDSSQ